MVSSSSSLSSSSLRTLQSLNDLKAPQNLNGLRLSESNDLSNQSGNYRIQYCLAYTRDN